MKATKKYYWILLLISMSFLFQNCKKEDLLVPDESLITEKIFSEQAIESDKLLVHHYNNKEIYVPDENFEQALIDLGLDDFPIDHYVQTKNIRFIKKLSISNKKINNLTGIEGFKSLKILICDFNNLTTLNLSQNLNLTHVCCIGNRLTSIDVSKNKNLLYLYCKCNLLESLNVSNNTKLVHLDCYDNNLNRLDISNNTALTCLFCNRNKLSSLDLSNNIKLTHLKTNYNLDLACVKVSENQLNDLPSGWFEDDYTNYQIVCN